MLLRKACCSEDKKKKDICIWHFAMCLSQIMIKLTSVVAFITVKSLNLLSYLGGS